MFNEFFGKVKYVTGKGKLHVAQKGKLGEYNLLVAIIRY